MAKKGQKHKKWTAEEKYKIIKPALDMEISTFQITKDTGLNNGMINNWIKAYKEEKLEYENMKLRIENELLKKGYLMKGDGTIVKFTK